MSPYRSREKRIQYGRDYRKRTGYDRVRRYGMTKEEYDRRVEECGSVCPICKEKVKLVVDPKQITDLGTKINNILSTKHFVEPNV
jgi:hypothetical protein